MPTSSPPRCRPSPRGCSARCSAGHCVSNRPCWPKIRAIEESTMSDKLIIFDTTLRDGEQSPGASMTKDEKLRIARQLERLKVDVIEAGFAASSNGDFEAVRSIARAIKEIGRAHV